MELAIICEQFDKKEAVVISGFEDRSLSARLAEIVEIEVAMIAECQAIVQPGLSYPPDMFVLGAIKRSLGLGLGFRTMIETRNFTCAAALLRLQLDTALRVSALGAAADVADLARRVLDGDRMDRMRATTGDKMNDRFLVRRLSTDYPWVERVYDETSSFIHLSAKAIFTSIAKIDEPSKTVYFQLSATDPIRDGETKYFEAVEAFRKSLKLSKALIVSYFKQRPT